MVRNHFIFLCRNAIATFLFLLCPAWLLATHIVGGDINYKYLGNNNYEIRLTIFRDCYNGVPPFDNPASLGFFNMNNALIKSIDMPFLGSDTIHPYIVSACFTPPLDVCYEGTVYIDTVNLPPIPGGYQIAYQRCCRNMTIVNINTPDNHGITIYGYIPDQNQYPINSNPIFNSWPPPFICLSAPFVWDHSAYDLDGDSIVYELCTPFDGADAGSPQPIPPNPPPYAYVPWQSPFSLSNLMGGVPMTINPSTGLITATPNTPGQFVIGVCANEYRNGILLSATKRDFQLNVVPCPNLVLSSFNVPPVICGNFSVNFLNNSFNAGSYLWNFGDNATLADTSNLSNPTYIYPDTGYYTITLIAYSDSSINCTDTITQTIHLLYDYQTGFSFTLDTCKALVSFTDTVFTVGNQTGQWFWNFGDNQNSTIQNPTHIYSNGGTYNIQLITHSSFGCIDTSYHSVTIPPLLKVNSSNISNEKCNGDCSGQISVTPTGGLSPYNYIWSIGGQPNNPTLDSLCAGIYSVTVSDSRNCTKTVSAIISSPPILVLAVSSTDAYCNGLCIGTATATASGGTGTISYLWNDPSSQTTSTASSLCPGVYNVLITDSNGCTKTDSVEVLFSTYVPPLDITAGLNSLILGQSTTLTATHYNNTSYSWTPNYGLSSVTVYNPIANPQQTTTYTVVISDALGCTNMDTITIFVRPAYCTEPEIYVPNAFSPNNDLHNDFFRVRGQAIDKVHIEIYDRWGQKVFESNDKETVWDGTFKGKLLAPAVFDYIVEVTCYDKNTFFKKGNVTLLH